MTTPIARRKPLRKITGEDLHQMCRKHLKKHTAKCDDCHRRYTHPEGQAWGDLTPCMRDMYNAVAKVLAHERRA